VTLEMRRTGTRSVLFFAPPAHSARTWRGRRVLTEGDTLKMDCPYPPDPDL
jgi:hypothetical protein